MCTYMRTMASGASAGGFGKRIIKLSKEFKGSTTWKVTRPGP